MTLEKKALSLQIKKKMCNHFAEGVGINAHEEPSDALVVPLLFLPRSLTVLWCKVTIHS